MQPTLGMFLSRDPWSGDVMRPGSMNGWNYVEGNPVNRVDPSGFCSQLPQIGLSDCEKFVAEVQMFITLAQSQGAPDGWIVMMLADYYAGIRAVNDQGFAMPFNPTDQIWGNDPGTYFQRPVQERWPTGDARRPLLNNYTPGSGGGEARAQYGFKRIFYDNTHHYFQVFYHAWFFGPGPAEFVNRHREPSQLTAGVQSWDQAAADLAVGDLAIRHFNDIEDQRYSAEYGGLSIFGIHILAGDGVMALLPQLLARDACGKTHEEIHEGMVPDYAEEILGPQ